MNALTLGQDPIGLVQPMSAMQHKGLLLRSNVGAASHATPVAMPACAIQHGPMSGIGVPSDASSSPIATKECPHSEGFPYHQSALSSEVQ